MPRQTTLGTAAPVAICVLTNHSPPANAVGVSAAADITATFDAELDSASVTSATFTVRGIMTGLYAGAWRQAIWTATAAWMCLYQRASTSVSRSTWPIPTTFTCRSW
ncbi:MAG: Ig-like domain-containing protein [Candidatus Promineifilaceae bacterium]|nr:Ig-like domain-containing protein [Candidatus Promineifilaceae bacterium]